MLHHSNQVCRIYDIGTVVVLCMFVFILGGEPPSIEREMCIKSNVSIILGPFHLAVTE